MTTNPHEHILKRQVPTAEYKRQYQGKRAHFRWMLHQATVNDLHETLLAVLENDALEFDKFVPGTRANNDLPEYFAQISNKSLHPEYLHPYTAKEFGNYLLYKVRGLDAGFALNGDDVVAVHNNSDRKGLVSKLLAKAKEAGGTRLDHFDGKLSSLYAEHFPEVYGTDAWNEEYAPKDWKYTPVDITTSALAQKHAEQGDNPDDTLALARKNYPEGKPHVILRRVSK